MFIAAWIFLLIETVTVVEAYALTENGYYLYIPADRVFILQFFNKNIFVISVQIEEKFHISESLTKK